ncbi:MAG: phosphatase [Acetivibrio ethanolgignens]
MKFCLDTHTHTLVSGHAYSTLQEMISLAREKGLELLAITEHAPAMPGTCHQYYFDNYRVLRDRDQGIRMLYGAELNIIDYEGHVDLPESVIKGLDLCIASLHLPCCDPGTEEENTNAYIQAMKNPYIHIIGHPDDSRYPIDYVRLVKAAKEYGIALEVNNSSLSPKSFRAGARENVIAYLKLCKEYEVKVTLGSDAHYCEDIANFSYAEEALRAANFPRELILNTSVDKFMEYLESRSLLFDFTVIK